MSSLETELAMILDERPVCFEEGNPDAVLETTLPAVFTDYLDLLLQNGTELFPAEDVSFEPTFSEPASPELKQIQNIEKGMSQFECVHCRVGSHDLLIPLDRIQRIEKLDTHHECYRVEIPECIGESHFVIKMMNDHGNIYVYSVAKILWVQSEDMLWRDDQLRAPWFVGTHKSLLCRLFDPDLLMAKVSKEIASISGELQKVDYS